MGGVAAAAGASARAKHGTVTNSAAATRSARRAANFVPPGGDTPPSGPAGTFTNTRHLSTRIRIDSLGHSP